MKLVPLDEAVVSAASAASTASAMHETVPAAAVDFD
jgi:hypothetical protein